MPKKTKAKTTGEWTKDYKGQFRGSPSAFNVKWEIEKTTGVLLQRDQSQSTHLLYTGSNNPPTVGFAIQLELDAARPNENWYTLHVRAWVPRDWYKESEFLAYTDRAFEHWTRTLQMGSAPGLLESVVGKLYEDRMREAILKEEQLRNKTEDPAPIKALQQAVLVALRSGKAFRTAHHEGGTVLFFDGTRFAREDWGIEPAFKTFANDDEMIACVREFYDWDSRKDTYPHRPPELEVWRFIQSQLR